jgi:transcriptional regulator with XRE-family HTH domain
VSRRKKSKRKASRRARTLIDIDALDTFPLPPGELDIGWRLVPDEIVTGPKLREFRNAQGWSEEELAKRLRISPDALEALESSPELVPDRIEDCVYALRQEIAATVRPIRLAPAKAEAAERKRGRPKGMTKDRIEEGRKLEALIEKHGGKRGAVKKAAMEVYSELRADLAYERARQTRKDYGRWKATNREKN